MAECSTSSFIHTEFRSSNRKVISRLDGGLHSLSALVMIEHELKSKLLVKFRGNSY